MMSNTIEIGTALRRVIRPARTAVSPRTPRHTGLACPGRHPGSQPSRLCGSSPWPRALIPVVFAFAVLAVLATAAPEQAAAQTVTTFISNTGQSIDSNVNNLRATAFTTGTGAYTLSSVAIYQGAQVHATPLVQIYDQSSGLPGNLVATMTNPGTLVNNAVNVFTAPANTTLNASTTYWVVTSNSADSEGIGFRVHRTTSSTLDSGTAAGWSLGGGAWRRRNTNPWATSTYRILFEIRGTGTAQTTTNAAPTLANAIPDQTAIAATGTAFSYQFPSNTFNDTDTGDTLSYTATQADGTDLPTWLTFTASTRTFTGTPTASDVETVSVRVTATDTSNATVSDGFDITVVNGAGICARTAAVRDALLVKITGVTDCAVVTDTHLAAITGALFLNGKYIPVLAPGDFDGLTALTRLNLFDTSLTGLPAGIFDELTAVTELAVNGNNLTGLPAGVFDNLTALTILGLSDNSLTGFPAGVFDNLTALTNLNLSGNSLTGLPAGVFDKLTALTYLSLSRNSLTALSAGVFDKLTALTELRLSFNDLTALPAGVFDELTALTALHLNNNRSLTGLPAGVFDGLTALTTLNLSNDSLTALPDDVFEPLTSLTTLDLPGNPGALFSPTAVALPDDGTVPAGGGTVMLDGSGSGGAWGTNVTYSWALTTPMSGVTVTFDDAAIAEPTVTIPQVTAGTDLVFTLTVTGRGGSNGISTATDTATVTPTATANAAPTVANTIPDQTATEGTAFSYQVPANTFNDTDTSDTLTYSATKPDDSTLPTWLSFDATTRTFTGTPAATDVETVAVKVTATDTSSATASDEFNIVVSAAANNAPDFTDTTLTRSLAENTAANTNVGAVIPAATDADSSDTLTYTMEGTDAGSFTFEAATRQIKTKTGVTYNFETKASYSVTIKADDNNGGTDTVAVTISLMDVAEQPVKPAAPVVMATSGSTTSLDVSWTVPDLNGGPALTGYEVQYREGTTGTYTAHTHSGTGTSTTIPNLTAGTSHQVQVRALNGETPSDWSEPGTGSTNTPANTAPAFSATTLTRSIAENTAANTNVGAVIPAATDADTSDTLTYTMEGADAGSFTFDASTRQIKTKTGVTYNFETKASYSVTIKADDSNGGADAVAVTISLMDVAEKPAKPAAPMVQATSGSTTSLDVSWTEPGLNGGPDITGYEVQYREGTTGAYTAHAHSGTGTSATIPNLTAGTSHQVQVRALNGETPSDWSDPGTGSTNTPANNAPMVANAIPDQTATADAAFTYQFPANTFNDTDTGDTLSYTATKADGTNLPTWLVFTDSTRTFAGTPASTDTGTVSLQVTATDTSSATDSDEFDILVVPELTLSFEDFSNSDLVEGNSLDVPVLLSGAPGREVTITLFADPSRGISGSDYTTSSLDLTFGASETRKVVTVTATDDSEVDPGERLLLALPAAADLPTGILLPSSGDIKIIQIADNDFQYQASHAGGTTLAVNEQAGTLTATVRVEAPNVSEIDLGALNENVVLSVSTADGTATAGQDYTSVSQTLTFAPADFASQDSGCPPPSPNFCTRADKTVTVSITDDTAYEGATAETFTLTLSHDTDQRVTYPSPAGETATVSIADDERPALTFTVAPTTILENAGTATVTLATTDGTGITADTAIALSLAGTATKGTDYTISSESLTLTAGQSSVTATITATMDSTSDDNETVVVTASSGGTAIGTAQTVTITETLPALSIAVDPASIAEAAGTSTVTVSTGTPFTADQTIALTLGGTATVTSDYTLSDTSLTLTAGATSVTTTVTAVQDTIDEPDETVIVSASNGGTAIGSATVTITDDDAPSTIVANPMANSAPELLTTNGATVSGDTLTLTYDELLDEDSEPPPSAYTVTVTVGTTTTNLAVLEVSVRGSRVILTLTAAPAETDVVTLTYTVPTGTGAMPVRDVAGNDAPRLIDQSVMRGNPPPPPRCRTPRRWWRSLR